jgi:hypothetical protein
VTGWRILPELLISDPTRAPSPWYARWAAPLLNDARDVALVALMMQCSVLAAAGVGLFFVDRWFWWLAAGYWAAVATVVLDRFTLMLHCTSHRQLFKPAHGYLNQVIPWLLGPFFGQTPETYFAHHMGMHHLEGNLWADLSSTMPYQRDRLDHWLRYWGRFMLIGVFDLAGYFARKKQRRLLRRVLVGEGAFWTTMVVLLFVNPRATAVVFLAPVLVMRTLMMAGNWAQHAFVCAAQPGNSYRSSITCLNTRYNRRCFNDGYHALHHEEPRCHWTDHPVHYQAGLAEYGRQDAVVFQGVDFFQVWLLLMAGRWQRLARAFVRLPGAPARTDAEVIAFLRSRMAPIAELPPAVTSARS